MTPRFKPRDIRDRLRFGLEALQVSACVLSLPPRNALQLAPDEVGLQAIRGELAIGVVHLLMRERGGQLQNRQGRRFVCRRPVDRGLAVDVDVRVRDDASARNAVNSSR